MTLKPKWIQLALPGSGWFKVAANLHVLVAKWTHNSCKVARSLKCLDYWIVAKEPTYNMGLFVHQLCEKHCQYLRVEILGQDHSGPLWILKVCNNFRSYLVTLDQIVHHFQICFPWFMVKDMKWNVKDTVLSVSKIPLSSIPTHIKADMIDVVV